MSKDVCYVGCPRLDDRRLFSYVDVSIYAVFNASRNTWEPKEGSSVFQSREYEPRTARVVDHKHHTANIARRPQDWKYTDKLFAAHCDQA